MEKKSELPVEYAEIVDDVIALIPQEKTTVGILQKSDLDALQTTLEKVKCFKRKYTLKKLTVENVEDKPAREKLRLALADLRSERTALTENKLNITKPYRDTVAYINSNYSKVIEAIEAVEKPLIDHNKQVKIDLEAKEKEAENAKKQKLFDRLDTLTKAGITFDGSYYSIGSEKFGVSEISFNAADIESMTDAIFNQQIEAVSYRVDLIRMAEELFNAEQVLIEVKRLEKEAADKAIFDAEQKKLREEKEKFDKERAEFEAEKEEMRLYKQKIADDKAAALLLEEQAEMDKLHKISELRREQLREIGFSFDYKTQYHKCMEFAISEVDIIAQPHTSWNEIIKDAKEKVSFELSKIEVAKKLKDEADAIAIANKAIADKEYADKIANQLAEEKLAAASDEVKWEHYLNYLRLIAYAPFTSKKYKNLVNIANEKIAEILSLDKN